MPFGLAFGFKINLLGREAVYIYGTSALPGCGPHAGKCI